MSALLLRKPVGQQGSYEAKRALQPPPCNNFTAEKLTDTASAR